MPFLSESRRKFSAQFKAEAVQLVLQSADPIATTEYWRLCAPSVLRLSATMSCAPVGVLGAIGYSGWAPRSLGSFCRVAYHAAEGVFT